MRNNLCVYIVLFLLINFSVASGQKIYIAENGVGLIYSADPDGNNLNNLGSAGFAGDIRDLSIDPITNRAFWLNGANLMVGDIITTSTRLAITNTSIFLTITGASPGDPTALEIDLFNREIFWVDAGNNAISKTSIDTSSPVVTPILTDTNIEGLALDPANGMLFYTRNITSNEIRRSPIDGSSAAITILDGSTIGFPDLREVTVNSSTATLYFSGIFSGIGQVWTANTDGTSPTMIIDNLDDVREIAVEETSGLIYYADQVTGTVGMANPDGSGATTIVTGLDGAVSVALDFDITAPPKVYWTEGEVTFNQGEIHRTDLDGNDFERYYDGFSTRLSGIAVDEANGHIYFSDGASAEIKRGEIGETGFINDTYELILDFNPSQDDSLEQVAWDPTNQMLYYTYWGINEVQRVDPNAATPMTTVTTIANVANPTGITVDNTNGKIYFTGNTMLTFNENIATLYRANLDGTSLEVLYQVSTNTFPIEIFYDVKVDNTNNRVYWSAGPPNQSGKIYYNDINESPPFTAPTSFSFGGEPRGIDLDLINNKIYWVCRGAGGAVPVPPGIMRANLDGSNIETIHFVNTGTPNPAFLSLDLRGLCASPPTASAGVDQSICADGSVTLDGTIGGGATTASWSTSGDGNFDDPNLIDATYTPGASDISNGTVNLAITTDDVGGNCPVATASVSISIEPEATAFAGTDQVICEDQTASLSASIGGSASSGTWSTSGDGNFANTNALATTYTPGANDISNGMATLTLTTDDPTGACTAVMSSLIITIESIITADAGVDLVICDSSPITLSGSMGGSATLSNWSTSGDGTFDDTSLLNATYTPGSNDLANGTVDLTLTASSSGPCTDATSTITLTVQPPPTAIDYNEQVSGNIQLTLQADNESTNGESLSVSIITQPSKGSATLNNGVLDYTVNNGESGTDLIEYQIAGLCGADIGTINLSIVNQPPSVNTTPATTQVGSVITIDLCAIISDPDNNFDELTISVISTNSGANTVVSGCDLTIDYANTNFSGNDEIVIEACDPSGNCDQNTLNIEVKDISQPTEVNIFNAVSPNNDGLNDFWEVQGLTQPNNIVLFNRWGDEVKTINNVESPIAEIDLSDLPAATYFYRINSPEGTFEGYVVIKK